jgi:hypothetical protein
MMIVKDETIEPAQKNLKIAYSKQLTGPYGKAGDPITGNYWAEGPTTLQLGREWLVYFDKYKDGHYGAIRSTGLKQWTDVSDKVSLPEGIRHGSILTISEKEFSLFDIYNK